MSSLGIHIPIGTGRKLNVHKTLSLRSVSKGPKIFITVSKGLLKFL